MSDCRFGVSPVNHPDPDPDHCTSCLTEATDVTQCFCRLCYLPISTSLSLSFLLVSLFSADLSLPWRSCVVAIIVRLHVPLQGQLMLTGVWNQLLWIESSEVCVKYKWAVTRQNQQSDCAPSEDSDQPGHPPSLIRVFAVHLISS